MSTLEIKLPDRGGTNRTYRLKATPIKAPTGPHAFNRTVFSAAHVVADPFSETEPSDQPAIDWDASMAFRRHLLDLGLGIAEAMDTAQRGMGLDWPRALQLIERSLGAATPDERDRIYSGVGTDQLDPKDARSIDDVVAAYMEQLNAVQKAGGRVILMASRALARVAQTPSDYELVYSKVLGECEHPAILHWLGEAFDPELAGYWGGNRFDETLETALSVIGTNAAKVDGIKISLLDDEKEITMRRRLPDGAKMYTGDDFNYPSLIKGDDVGYSHALLGIFDPIATAASAALGALSAGDIAAYDRILEPTIPLSRHIFRAPTQYYKTGVVFLAWLNGFQDHFVMVGGAQSMRPLPYFVDLFTLADQADILQNPELAALRMTAFLRLYGFDG